MNRERPAAFVGHEIYREAAYGTLHPLAIARVEAVVDLCRALGWFRPGEYEAISTHPGMSNVGMMREVTSTPVIRPAVFCASFDPCDRLKAAAEINCSLRK